MIGGVTGAEVPAPVKNPPPSGLMIRRLVTRVESPTRIRHRTTVPFTGEESPPGARRSDASERLLNVGRGLYSDPQFGSRARSLPIVTTAPAGETLAASTRAASKAARANRSRRCRFSPASGAVLANP